MTFHRLLRRMRKYAGRLRKAVKRFKRRHHFSPKQIHRRRRLKARHAMATAVKWPILYGGRTDNRRTRKA